MNSNVKQRFNEIVHECDKYSDGEVHDIKAVLCFIRDTNNDEDRNKAERLLHAFITRKKLGDVVCFKKLKEEFGCE